MDLPCSKKRGGVAAGVCAALAVFSLLLLLPFVRQGIISCAERLLVHRLLRDAGKWHRLLLRCAGVQLLLSLAAAWAFGNWEALRVLPGSLVRAVRPVHVYAFLLLAAFVAQHVAYVCRPDKTGWFLDSTNLWDHYVSVQGAAASRHLGMYPPLAALAYRFCAAMLPEGLRSGGWRTLAYSDQGSYLTLLYYLSALVPFCLLCYAAVDGTRGRRLLVAAALCCSMPLLFSLMRGNIVVLSCCAAFFFTLSVKSDRPLVRAAGLLALFAAVGTKLYPVAFVMLLVKERQWRMFRVCLLLLFALFVFLLSFFDGGMSELSNMLRGIRNFTGSFAEHHNLSLKRQVWDVLSFFSAPPEARLFSAVYAAALLLYLAGSALLFFCTKKRWVELMLLTLSCLLLPGIVRPYTEVFLVIPLVEMLNCREKDVFLCLSLVFCLPMLLFLCGLAYFVTMHSALVTFPLFALCAAEVARERAASRKGVAR